MVIMIRKKAHEKDDDDEGGGSCKYCRSAFCGCLLRGWARLRGLGWGSLFKILGAVFFIASTYVIYLRPLVLDNNNNNTDDLFAKPFCDERGICHERPDHASPRTHFSAWNKDQYNLWWDYYESLQTRVETYAQKRQKLYEDDLQKTNRSRPLLLLGDSITESWSGTGLGVHKVRAEGVPEVLEEVLGSMPDVDPIVLGVSGDQTQHLLYRLENDHMRAAQLKVVEGKKGSTLRYDPGAVFVVMIGTNNLGSGEVPGPTARGILAVVNYILRETREAGCRVMLFRVLPRGDGPKVLPTLCPPRCSDPATREPYASFQPAIDKTNGMVADGIPGLSEDARDRFTLVDCNSEFANASYDSSQPRTNAHGEDVNIEVKPELMPDLLHPNAEGHRIMANCIKDYLKDLPPLKRK
jgi:lysophospholipase L1-like esterase